jgi:hypothetical protein
VKRLIKHPGKRIHTIHYFAKEIKKGEEHEIHRFRLEKKS